MHPTFQLLATQMQEARDKIAEDLVQGSIKDIGEYRYYTGIARGYMLSKSMVADLAHRLDKDEDDDDP